MPDGKERDRIKADTQMGDCYENGSYRNTVGGYTLDSFVSRQKLAIGSCAYSNNFISTQSIEFSYYM
jgi:hypothetical protein